MGLYKLSIKEVKEQLQKKEISAEEYIKNILERIEKFDPLIKSFITVDKEGALKEASKTDERIKLGKPLRQLEGIPVAVKDNICTKGMKTTCASKMLENFIPDYDATIIEKIKNHGGIIIGKTNMDEFAMGSSCENSSFFNTKNPWNLNYTPGGSSGGSAAAVAANFVPLSIGTDTGGSTRQPASLSGVLGFKPTYGRVSRYGMVAFSNRLDQAGPMARNIEDLVILMKVIAGHDIKDSTSANVEVPCYEDYFKEDLSGQKIGIPKEYFDDIPEDIKKNCLKAIDIFKRKGAEIIEISLPHTKYGIPAYYIIATSEASSNLSRFSGMTYGYKSDLEKIDNQYKKNPNISYINHLYRNNRAEGFGPEVKRRVLLGTYSLSSGYYDDYYIKALKVRTVIKQEIEKALEKVDVIVTPTSPVCSFKMNEKTEPLEMYLCDIFTVNFNLSGNPAISIPCGLNKKGLPIGLQIIGNLFDEQRVFQFAYTYEKNGNSIGLPNISSPD